MDTLGEFFARIDKVWENNLTRNAGDTVHALMTEIDRFRALPHVQDAMDEPMNKGWREENVNSHVVIGDERWVEGWKRGYMRASLDAEGYPEMLRKHAKKHHQQVAEMRDQLMAEQEARLRIQNDEALINVG